MAYFYRRVMLSILGIKGMVEFFWNANFVVWHTAEKKTSPHFMPTPDPTNRVTICIRSDATST